MSMSSYTLEVGKDNFKQTVEIKLPEGKRIGVLVSGGADSAILLYILAKLNLENNSPCKLIPFTVAKTDGSRPFAEIVVGYVSKLLNVELDAPIIVGDPALHHSKQVLSGRNEAMEKFDVDCIVYGSQQVPPKDLIDIDWEYPFRPDQIEYKDEKAYCPFALLDKRHTIDLYRIFDRFDLLALTHSCTMVSNGRCYKCFNCIERDWALKSLGITDPGNL